MFKETGTGNNIETEEMLAIFSMTNYQVPINLDHYCKRVPALEQNHFSSAIRKYIFIFLH